MKPNRRTALVGAIALLGVLHVPAADPPPDPEQQVLAALAAAPDIPAQAIALADLAWPAGEVDPETRARARAMLIEYRDRGMPAIRGVIASRVEHSGDAVAALVEAGAITQPPIPTVYGVALDDALWFGSHDARLRALEALRYYRGPRRVLSMMDAAEEAPSLVLPAIDALATTGDDHARLWLRDRLFGDDEQVSARAAFALASIGSRAFHPLVEALRGDDRRIRETAARFLAMSSTPDELPVLEAYLEDYPDDDPDIRAAIRERTVVLEEELERRYGTPAASGDS